MDPLDLLIARFDAALRTVAGVHHAARPSPGQDIVEGELGETGRAEAAALMRVNHVGEVCAQALYQAQALTTFADIPLVVLTAKANVDAKPGWGTAQDQMAALSTNSRHTVENQSHVGLLTDPTGATHTVAAITDVLAAVRTHTPLPTR